MINDMTKEIMSIAKDHGFVSLKPSDWNGDVNHVTSKLVMIHSEVSEALEALRHDDLDNFGEELADIVIRVLDCGGGLGLNMEDLIIGKIKLNREREYQHGGKRF